MHPSLHSNVSSQLSDEGIYIPFNPTDDDSSCTKSYNTNIMGRFPCRNRSCTSSGWSSKKIAVTIRMYGYGEPGDSYNARVYHQRCKGCNGLSKPVLDKESYVDRVVYRLMKWSGVEMEAPTWVRRESKGPHDNRLCEGCKAGRCREGGFW
jgi:hypothetical protein